MCIHINQCGVDMNKEHIRWMSAMIHHVFKGTAHGVGNMSVANVTMIYILILHIGQRA